MSSCSKHQHIEALKCLFGVNVTNQLFLFLWLMTITGKMFIIIISDKIIFQFWSFLLLIAITYRMNAFIISNKNNDALVAMNDTGSESCDHTTLMLCSHMTRLPLTLQCSIEGVQLQVMWSYNLECCKVIWRSCHWHRNVALSKGNCRSCDLTTWILQGHMTWLLLTPQCASYSIELDCKSCDFTIWMLQGHKIRLPLTLRCNIESVRLQVMWPHDPECCEVTWRGCHWHCNAASNKRNCKSYDLTIWMSWGHIMQPLLTRPCASYNEQYASLRLQS